MPLNNLAIQQSVGCSDGLCTLNVKCKFSACYRKGAMIPPFKKPEQRIKIRGEGDISIF